MSAGADADAVPFGLPPYGLLPCAQACAMMVDGACSVYKVDPSRASPGVCEYRGGGGGLNPQNSLP